MRPEPTHSYDFRPFAAADLALLRRWLRTPHVARWWGEADKEVADVAAALGSDGFQAFVILMDDRPIGYLQSYEPHKEPGHPYRDQPHGTIGIDLSIGEPDLINQGHGARIIDAFVERLFEAGAPRVVIDPDPANAAAIRAYQKAGFHALGERTTKFGPALMMARDAHDETRVQ